MNAAQFDGGSHQGWSSSSVGSRCECACVLGGVGAGWRGAAEPHSPLYTLCSLAQVLTIRSPASLQAAGWLLARSGEASLGGGVSPLRSPTCWQTDARTCCRVPQGNFSPRFPLLAEKRAWGRQCFWMHVKAF